MRPGESTLEPDRVTPFDSFTVAHAIDRSGGFFFCSSRRCFSPMDGSYRSETCCVHCDRFCSSRSPSSFSHISLQQALNVGGILAIVGAGLYAGIDDARNIDTPIRVRLRLAALEAERDELMQLRDTDVTNDEMLRVVQSDIVHAGSPQPGCRAPCALIAFSPH